MIGKRKGGIVFAQGKDKEEIVTKLRDFYEKHDHDFYLDDGKVDVEFYVVSEQKEEYDLRNRDPFTVETIEKND